MLRSNTKGKPAKAALLKVINLLINFPSLQISIFQSALIWFFQFDFFFSFYAADYFSNLIFYLLGP